MKKSLIRVSLGTGLLLLIPLTLQLTIGTGVDGQGWNWKLNDFVAVGIALFFFGLAYEFLASLTDNRRHRVAIGIAVLLALAFLWANVVNDFDVLETWLLKLT